MPHPTPATLKSHPLRLGHRGARSVRSIPENSIASFDRALADGCDGFEFDVRLTEDEEAVVCHDPHVDGIEIAQASAAQLPALPRLRDVLERYRDRAFLDIELKVQGLETITIDLLAKFPPRRGFVISSFVPSVLQTLYVENPALPLGLICELPDELADWPRLPVSYVVPQHTLLTSALLAEIHAAGKKILVWTVNSAAAMIRFRDLGVAGMISDRTELLCRTLPSPR